METEITSAKLVGNPDASGWVQAYEYVPEDEEKKSACGKLFAVISTSSAQDKEDIIYSGREILSRLHEEYFGNTEGSPFERMKKAVSKVAEEFSSWDEIEIGCISVVGDLLYLASSGGAEIHLFRNGALYEIIKSEEEDLVSASGYAEEGDLLVIGTKNFFLRFAKGVIKGALLEKNPGKAVEALAPAVYSGDRVGSIGAYFLKVGKKELTLDSEVSVAKSSYDKLNYAKDYTGSPGQGLSVQKMSLGKIKGLTRIFEKLKEKSVYIRSDVGSQDYASPQRKLMASVGALLLLLLLVSIFFGIYQNSKRKAKEAYEEKITSARHELSEAEELYVLNPGRARELFHGARGKILSLSDEGYEDTKVLELKEEIKRKENEILKEFRDSGSLYVDLSLLSQGFEGEMMVFSAGKVYILDTKSERLISVEVSSKRSEIVLGPQALAGVSEIAVYSERIFELKEEGIIEVNENEKVVDKDWSGDILIYTFAGNIYLLEKERSDISRYSGLETGFSSRKSWLTQGTTPDLTDARNMLIDGSIWVLKNDGKIIKLTYGNPQNFAIEGVNPDIFDIQNIFTHEETQGLYLLDKENERVVVVDKDGKYIAQYYSGILKEAKSLVVSEKGKKMIILTGDKLFTIDLKHM